VTQESNKIMEIKFLPYLLGFAVLVPLISFITTYTLSYTYEHDIPDDQPIPFLSTTLNDPPARCKKIDLLFLNLEFVINRVE
jgi:hypothetical protein